MLASIEQKNLSPSGGEVKGDQAKLSMYSQLNSEAMMAGIPMGNSNRLSQMLLLDQNQMQMPPSKINRMAISIMNNEDFIFEEPPEMMA